MKVNDLPPAVVMSVRRGVVIPAMPLALDSGRRFDAARQRALVRYYVDAGAGGVSAGVHTTQFAIRAPGTRLFEPVLSLVSEAADEWCAKRGREVLKVAGVCGATEQALGEARFALENGYHAVLLGLGGLADLTADELVAHCRAVAGVMPVIGFYLQPAVGGRVLPFDFWRRFAEIENVLAIKIAPFSRYQTFDVVRAVCEAGREEDVVLYTGNDDNIVVDLLSEYRIATPRGPSSVRIRGGLLGHWSVWTRRAVELLEDIHDVTESGRPVPQDLLTRGIEVTDANAAVFDAANGFAGCIAGIHEVLRRQGLLEGTWCLDPGETLSPGQAEEIDRVRAAYPHLSDDDFVAEGLPEWLP